MDSFYTIFIKNSFNQIIMVKIIEKSLEEKVSEQKTVVMFEMANQLFEGIKNEWAASHPRNIQRKYILEMNGKYGHPPIPGVGFSLWAVKPVNGPRRHEQLNRVIDIYPGHNKVSVSNLQYFDDALQLAERYERAFTQEFTVEKEYHSA